MLYLVIDSGYIARALVYQVFIQLSHLRVIDFYKEIFFLSRKNKSLWPVLCAAKMLYLCILTVSLSVLACL